ncbi:MAG: hypothetical protein IT453_13320 [Planctomycetes bacterium]|nr:hypothetical protein [Planctomycetota bacterium]
MIPLQAPVSPPPAPAEWTVLVYGAGDNSSEETLIGDLAAMQVGLAGTAGIELVALVDRSPRWAKGESALGEDFADTRLFRLGRERFERLEGGDALPATLRGRWEANTGDPKLVRDFVRFGKALCPARHTALVFYSHGDGRAFAFDESSFGDPLFPGELTAELGPEESVDFIGFDVCSMGSVELAYELRPGPERFGAHAMVASASVSAPWRYDLLFGALGRALGSGDVDALAFGGLALESIAAGRKQWAERGVDLGFEAWACFDLTRAGEVKSATDALAVSIANERERAPLEALRGSDDRRGVLDYFPAGEDAWGSMPYFDAHDLARRIAAEPLFSETTRQRARALAAAVDGLVTASFAVQSPESFVRDSSGASIVLPDGARESDGSTDWQRLAWYSAVQPASKRGFGRLAWCADGAEFGDGVVQNWFELLDSWFDPADADGPNGWRW